MKKKSLNKKMNLNKETVVSLSSSKMNELQGGGTQYCSEFPKCSGVQCPLPTRLVDATCNNCNTYNTCTSDGYGCYSNGPTC